MIGIPQCGMLLFIVNAEKSVRIFGKEEDLLGSYETVLCYVYDGFYGNRNAKVLHRTLLGLTCDVVTLNQ
jgi:hypothetical protein